MDFDVDEWQRLAREDPAEFERRRQATVEALITHAPPEHRKRLRALQSRIDLERRRAKTPLGAAVRLNSMMWERFGQLRGALQALAEGEPVPERENTAQILPFPKPD
jgi:hypothetical protein